LQRVTARAQQEAAKATFLRKKKEELQQQLVTECGKLNHNIKQMKQNIAHKEKEISRLSFLAEQDKKTGMFLCQQIAQLRKSIEGFLQAKEESKPESLCNILARCSSSTDLYGSPPSSPVSCVAPVHTTTTMRTAIGKETEMLMLEDEKKSQELARVKLIVEQESKRVEYLKAKVEELKQALVAELQRADEQLSFKMKEFMQKQQAIEKVAARAERERARSVFLKDEIVKLTNTLGMGKESSTKRKGKNDEYGPDMAYLSSFSELSSLPDTPGGLAPSGNDSKPSQGDAPSPSPHPPPGDVVSQQQHATSLPLSILRGRDAPNMYIFSPPCRTIPISPASESIYAQKLKDIAVLNRETTKKDEELVRLKKLAEAERCRHLLLKDKFDQLRIEIREREAYNACTL
jgi:hypothetical protein